jgi:hypothetical protein
VGESLPGLLCPRCRAPLDAGAEEVCCASCGTPYAREEGILKVLQGESGAPGYDPHDFEDLSRVENSKFWYVSRRELILDALKRHVPSIPS